MTIDKIFKTIEKEKIQFIDLWFSDILGSVKNETIALSQVKKALTDGIWFDGSSVEGFGRIFESDMYLKPDLQTFTIIPWGKERTARFICDVYAPDHKPAPVSGGTGLVCVDVAGFAEGEEHGRVQSELGRRADAQPGDRRG